MTKPFFFLSDCNLFISAVTLTWQSVGIDSLLAFQVDVREIAVFGHFLVGFIFPTWKLLHAETEHLEKHEVLAHRAYFCVF